MLVLSRKKNEKIMIGPLDVLFEGKVLSLAPIEVVVVEIRGDKVRLGLEAPKEIPIHRAEVYVAIQSGEPRKTLPPAEAS